MQILDTLIAVGKFIFIYLNQSTADVFVSLLLLLFCGECEVFETSRTQLLL